MNPYDDNEDQEIEELAEKFKQSVESGEPMYFDSLDLQDIISLFLENNDLESCKQALDQALTTYPDEAYFWMLRSKYYAVQFRFEEAERDLQYAEEHFEAIPELYLQKVLLAHASNKKINALELLQRALEMDEAIPETHLLLTIEYVNCNQIADAVQHASRAIELDPTAAEDLKILVMDFSNRDSEEFQRIIDFFAAMAEEMPLNSHMWCGLGMSYLNNGDFEHAIEAFQFQSSVDTDDPFAYVNLGECYFGIKEYAAAAENFKMANEKCDFFKFNIQIGRCYAKMERFDEALQYFSKADEQDPFYLLKYSEIVKVFKDLGQLDYARSFLRLHISECPNENRALEELLGLLNPESDWDEMIELCNKISSTYDDTFEFLNFVTVFSYTNNCPDLALNYCNEHLDDDSVTESIGYFLAALYFKKGWIQLGCQHLENAILIEKSNCIPNFLHIDPHLREIPEVAEILHRNNLHWFEAQLPDFEEEDV